jgi:kumamolisin
MPNRKNATASIGNRRRGPGLAPVKEIGTRMPRDRQYLSLKEFESAHGAAPDDLVKVEQFADEHGLSVVEVSPARRTLVLSGTVASLSDAFGVCLAIYEYPGGTYRGRTGPVHVPAELADVVEGVFGLDNRPQAQLTFRCHRLRRPLSFSCFVNSGL